MKKEYAIHIAIIAIMFIGIIGLLSGIKARAKVDVTNDDLVKALIENNTSASSGITSVYELNNLYYNTNDTIDLTNPENVIMDETIKNMLYVVTKKIPELTQKIRGSNITLFNGAIITNPEQILNKTDNSPEFESVNGCKYNIYKYNVYLVVRNREKATPVGTIYTLYNIEENKLQNIEYLSFNENSEEVDLGELETNSFVTYDASEFMDGRCPQIKMQDSRFTMQSLYGVEMPWCQSAVLSDVLYYLKDTLHPELDIAKTYLPIFFDHESGWKQGKSPSTLKTLCGRNDDWKYVYDIESWVAVDPDTDYRSDQGMSEYQIRDIIKSEVSNSATVYNNTQYGYISSIGNKLSSSVLLLGLDNILGGKSRHISPIIGVIDSNTLIGYTTNANAAENSVYMVYTVNSNFGTHAKNHLSNFNLFLEGKNKQYFYTPTNTISINSERYKEYVDGIRGNFAETGVGETSLKADMGIDLIEDKVDGGSVTNSMLVNALISQSVDNRFKNTIDERYAVGGITPDKFDEYYSGLYDILKIDTDSDKKYRVDESSRRTQDYLQFIKQHTELGAFITIVKLTEAELNASTPNKVGRMPLLNIRAVASAVDDSGVEKSVMSGSQSKLLNTLLNVRYHKTSKYTSMGVNAFKTAFNNGNFALMNFSNTDGTNRRSILAYNIDINKNDAPYKYTIAYVDYASIVFGSIVEGGTHYIDFNDENGHDIKVSPVESVLESYHGEDKLDLVSIILVPNHLSYNDYTNLEYTNLGLRTKKKLNELDVKQVLLSDNYNWEMVDEYYISETEDEQGIMVKEADTELGIRLRFIGTEDEVSKLEIIDSETLQVIDTQSYKQRILSYT